MITVVVAALGLAGTLAAAVTGVRVQAAVTRRQSDRHARSAALTNYVFAVNAYMAELGALPPVDARGPGWIRRRLAAHGGEIVLYLYVRIIERLIFGERIRRQVDRLAEAHAQLVVCRPSSELIEIIDDVNRFIGDWTKDVSAHRRAWPELARRLNEAVALEMLR
jgi:hypothetical protein